MSGLCQLAASWSGRDLPIAATVEEKRDGFRALWLRDHQDKPGLYSRNGIPLPGVEHITHQLAAFERHAGQPLFLDGEFCVGETDTLATTKRWVERDHKFGGTAGKLYLFDGLAFDDWMRGGTDTPLWQRKERLQALALAVETDQAHAWDWRPGSRGDEPNPVELVTATEVWCVDDAIEQAGAIWASGGEGIMLKDLEAPYRRCRSNAWLKIGRPWRDKINWKRAA
jgi:ATP-dependent DNA ligase